MLGDNAYNSGTDSEYQRGLFDIFPEILKNTPVWPTMGNHEGYSGKFYGISELPTNGQSGGVPSGTEKYYFFDHGNIHFICLNSEETPPGMIAWLASRHHRSPNRHLQIHQRIRALPKAPRHPELRTSFRHRRCFQQTQRVVRHRRRRPLRPHSPQSPPCPPRHPARPRLHDHRRRRPYPPSQVSRLKWPGTRSLRDPKSPDTGPAITWWRQNFGPDSSPHFPDWFAETDQTSHNNLTEFALGGEPLVKDRLIEAVLTTDRIPNGPSVQWFTVQYDLREGHEICEILEALLRNKSKIEQITRKSDA